MKIVIIGAGEVGRHLCQQLSLEEHDVILVDRDSERLRRVERDLNIMTIEGNGASAKILEDAGTQDADLFIAVTNIDEVNLIACLLAKEFGALRRVARVRSEEYLLSSSPLNEQRLGIDLIINPDQVMAEEIMKVSRITEGFEVVDFAHGDVVLIGYQIRQNNPICGMPLAEIKNLKGLYDFVIVAIVRGDKTIIPRGGDTIQAGDRAYFILKRDHIKAVEEILEFKSKPIEKVFILGGGHVGYQVARAMEREGLDVYLIEQDPRRCELLAEQLKSTVVLNFDGLDAQDLLQEGIDTADLFIAVTGGDTTNILSSLLAKHHGARKCITRISRPDFIPLLGKLGIDVALSSRLVAANMILRFVRRGVIVSAAALLGSDAEALEFIVSGRWQYVDKELKDIDFPEGTIVAAIVRKEGEVIIPSGDTAIHAGDRLIIFCKRERASKLEKLLSL
jgi:trk system potassium uptake protein TrkA